MENFLTLQWLMGEPAVCIRSDRVHDPLSPRPGHSRVYRLYSLVLIARARVQRSCMGRDVYAAMVGTTLLPTYSTNAVGPENPGGACLQTA